METALREGLQLKLMAAAMAACFGAQSAQANPAGPSVANIAPAAQAAPAQANPPPPFDITVAAPGAAATVSNVPPVAFPGDSAPAVAAGVPEGPREALAGAARVMDSLPDEIVDSLAAAMKCMAAYGRTAPAFGPCAHADPGAGKRGSGIVIAIGLASRLSGFVGHRWYRDGNVGSGSY